MASTTLNRTFAIALAVGLAVTGVQVAQTSPVAGGVYVAQAQERDPKNDLFIKAVEGPDANGVVTLTRNDNKKFTFNVNNGVQNITYDKATNTLKVLGADGKVINTIALNTTTVTPGKDGKVTIVGVDDKGNKVTQVVATTEFIDARVKEILNELETATKDIDSKLTPLRETVKKNETLIKEIDGKIAEANATAKEAREYANTTRTELTNLINTNRELTQSQINDIKATAKQAEDDANAAFEAAQQTQRDLLVLRDKLTNENARIDSLIATKERLVNGLKNLNENLTALEGRVDEAEQKLITAREDLTVLEGKIDANAQDIENARADVKALEEEVEKNRADFEAEKQRTAAERKKLAGRLTLIEGDIEDIQGKIMKINKDIAKLDAAAKKAQKTADEANANVIVKGERNADNTITLTKRNGTTITIAAANKYGLEKCAAELGGGLLAAAPLAMTIAWAAGNSQLPGIDDQIAQAQKQLGVYNEDVARFVSQNGGAIAATLGTVSLLGLLFTPGLCGDQSIAEAAKESFRMGALKSKTPVSDEQWEKAGGIKALSSEKAEKSKKQTTAPTKPTTSTAAKATTSQSATTAKPTTAKSTTTVKATATVTAGK